MNQQSVLEAWLDELPEEEIQREMEDWEARMREAQIEYSKRREVLELKRRWRAQYATAEVPTSRTTVANAADGGEQPETLFPKRPSSIRESVLQTFASEPSTQTWTTPEIRDALVARGWMENTEKAMRSLQSALSRMKAEEKIIRVRHGVYRSAALEAASSLAAASDSSDREDAPD